MPISRKAAPAAIIPGANGQGGQPQGQEAKIALQVDLIPPELRALDRWVCWQQSPSGKPPINANLRFNGRHEFAKVNDPATWSSFDAAVKYWQDHLLGKGPASGLSFALTGDGIVAIDLDDCREPTHGGLDGRAGAIIRQHFSSYTEISPSGTGIHIFRSRQVTAIWTPQSREDGSIRQGQVHVGDWSAVARSWRLAVVKSKIDARSFLPGMARFSATALSPYPQRKAT